MVLLPLYRAATDAAAPLVRHVLRWRLARGKEDGARLGERAGIAGLSRPEGKLVWLHAASVGEVLSVLPMAGRILDERPGLHLLVTTGTVTAAGLLAERLPPRALHQYAPVDRAAWVGRFLDHWRPDAAIRVESELWPNALCLLRRRGIPSVLLNARMTGASARNWRRWAPGAMADLLGAFRFVLAQDEITAARYRALGARDVRVPGNLKLAAPPLPADPLAFARLAMALDGRPRWLAASTHPREEESALAVHRALASRHPGLVTLVVPRHPPRGVTIVSGLAAAGLRVVRRADGALPGRSDDIYIADTIGELGLFYRAARIAFVGGSLVPHGGHNPFEPAQLGCAVLHGPHMDNFPVIVPELEDAGAARRVADGAALTDAVGALLASPGTVAAMGDAGMAVAARHAATLDRVCTALAPFLDAAAPRGAGGGDAAA
ncbi:MAG: 3-deoxy-D-manno-octulosonic acid transferase [Alphaproteobacteria bacterium]|nr:3-deoxy-D-manno-octulosonic acid transferase [Alphaproteobacteria bacterium]